MSNWSKEIKNCKDNKLCLSEVDAKVRGNWFFQMDVVNGLESNVRGLTTVGSFEVLAFAPTLSELNSDEQIDINESEPAEIYVTLNRIHRSEAMAFLKLSDSFSTELANSFATKGGTDYDRFRFTLRRFSKSGGMTYEFKLEMKSIFILDIKKDGIAEKVLITYSKTQLGASVPGNDAEMNEAFKNSIGGK